MSRHWRRIAQGPLYVALSSWGFGASCIPPMSMLSKMNRPKVGDAWANKGSALFSLGKCEESLNASKKALELDKTMAFAWANKSLALFGLGKCEESLDA